MVKVKGSKHQFTKNMLKPLLGFKHNIDSIFFLTNGSSFTIS